MESLFDEDPFVVTSTSGPIVETKQQPKPIENMVEVLTKKQGELTKLLSDKTAKGAAHKSRIRQEAKAIDDMTKDRQSGELPDGKLTLRYVLTLGDMIAEYLNLFLKGGHSVISAAEAPLLYSLLFEKFVINEIRGHHQAV